MRRRSERRAAVVRRLTRERDCAGPATVHALALPFLAIVATLLLPRTVEAEIYPDENNINWCYQKRGSSEVIIRNVGDIPKYLSAIDPNDAVGTISVPAVIDGRRVVEIGEGAFSNCTQLATVIIPEGVSAIAAKAFVGCSALANVQFPTTVNSIGDSAFSGCDALADVNVAAASELSVGTSAFSGCNAITNVRGSAASGLSVGNEAFAGCGALAAVELSSTADVRLSASAFAKTISLCRFVVTARDFSADGSFGASFSSDVSAIKDVSIVATNVWLNETFQNCSKLTNVLIEAKSANVGGRAFASCTSLPAIVFPAGTTNIGVSAFSSCTFSEIALPAGLKNVGDSAFAQCTNLQALVFSTNVTAVGDRAFSGCARLPEVLLPGSIQALGEAAFGGCSSLTNVRFAANGDGRTAIGASAFAGCSALTDVALSSNVVSIGMSAFDSCGSLARLFLAEGLESIGDLAFYDCFALEVLRFPSSVKSIGEFAFYRCRAAREIAFAKDSLDRGTLSIGRCAFMGCSSVTNLNLSDCAVDIGYSAFQDLKSLVRLNLPSALQEIADTLLGRCEALESVDLPESLRSIGATAFAHGTNLFSFTIPSGLEIMGQEAFFNTRWWNSQPDNSVVVKDGWVLGVKGQCPASVSIPTNVRHVADYAFNDCATLTNLFVPANVQTIGAHAFSGCTNFTAVEIADGVQVDDTAFDGSNWSPMEGWVDVTVSPTNYYVAFDANGGNGNMATQTFRVGVAKALSTNQFTRLLYGFDGWSNMSTGRVAYVDGQVVSNLTETANATVGLYAHWTALTNLYTVAFNANGGSGTMSNQTFAVGQGQTLNTNRFSRNGFAFQGWGTSSTGTVAYTDGQFVENLATNSGATASLYALWTMMDGVIKTERVGGCVWHYMIVSNDSAAIVNDAGGRFVRAVEAPGITSLVVPGKLGGATVTAIAENAFAGCSGVTNIAIPPAVASIGANAFAGCSSLISVTMPVPAPLFELMPDCYRQITKVSVPSGASDFLNDDISVCDYAFSNCTSLVSVSLPLGVTELPVGLFADCSALVDFEMPYTVKTIAENAFAGCTALAALTVTENVSEIGANVFSGCSELKIVRYLGDEPESVASNIYQKANRTLVSGYLKGMRSWPSAGEGEEPEPVDASQTNATSVVTASVVSVTWPSGDDGRLLMAWNTEKYSFKKVTLDYGAGGTPATADLFYVEGRVLGDLPDPDDLPDPPGGATGNFDGWFTARYGGEKVDRYTIVTAAMTVYAHWDDAGGGSGRGAVEAFEPFYDDDGFAFTAATFDGILLDNGKVAGTVRVKTQKGKYSSAADGTNSAFAATIQVLGAKKTSLRGLVAPDGTASAENEKKGLALELEFTQFGFSGTYSAEDGNYEIVGARDRYSAGSDEAKALVWTALANAKGAWGVVLPVESAEGAGAALAQGYAGLSATIGTKGKSRIVGTMPDGTRVAVSSTLIVGDGCACLPVVVPLYAGKSGGFAFALWFTWSEDGSESQVNVAGLSGWDATQNKSAPFEATFGEPIVGHVSSGVMTGTKTFGMDDFFDEIEAEDGFSPNGTEIEISGARWKVPRADGVRFSKDDGWHVADEREYGNPAGLKLTYSAKTGTFKGSFKVFAGTDEGRSKKYTATVTGVAVEGVGYGTATIKKVGSVPVKIE